MATITEEQTQVRVLGNRAIKIPRMTSGKFIAWLILVAEPVLAVLILSGRKARAVWTLTSLFMFLLVAGQTILMKPDVIANWEFLVLVLLCAALSEPDSG